MTTKALAFLGPILRILRVPVYLWYSHQATPTSLRLSLPFINLVFSPTKESFPIQTEKLLPTGHGITVKATPYLESRVRVRDWSSIVVIGRIARVKRIEDLLIAVKSSSISDLKIELIGPIQDQEYKLWLQDLATELGIELQFLGSLNRKDLETTIRKKAIIYSGTCASVDKAPLEAAAMGCLVITNNVDLQILSGMSHFWMRAFCMDGAKISLEKQIQILTSSPVLEASISEAQSIALENNLESLVKELSAKITISRPPCLKK
jgi:glycosyltransferase involved in cell wall biosynthesis